MANQQKAKQPKKPLFDSAISAGAFFAVDEQRAASATALIVELVSALKTYEAFDAFRAEFKRGAEQAGYEAAEKLWSRRALMPAKAAGYEPPKSPAPDAERKSGERSKQAERVADLVKTHKTVEALNAEIAKLPADATHATRKTYADALLKVSSDAEKSAKEKARESVEKSKKVLADAVKALNAAKLEQLARIATLMASGATFEVRQVKQKAAQGAAAAK